MGDRFAIASAKLGKKPVAGFAILLDPANSDSTIHLLGIRYSSKRNIHLPVTFLNWKAISWAHGNGIRYVDFGSYSVAESSKPKNPNFKLKKRSGLAFLPRSHFALPTSSLSYSIARRIGGVL
jgi:hypothetical protein